MVDAHGGQKKLSDSPAAGVRGDREAPDMGLGIQFRFFARTADTYNH